MEIISLFIFIVVQIIFIPFALVGVILLFYKQMYVSKKLGVSSTAIEIINGRWAMDVFGLRKDTASTKLIRVLPNTSLTGLWLALIPCYVRYKISGTNKIYPTIAEAGEEGLGNIVTNRTMYFDRIIDKSKEDVEQFIIMGAGLDTRAYGNLNSDKLAFFELDQPKTQEFKIGHLKKQVSLIHMSIMLK